MRDKSSFYGLMLAGVCVALIGIAAILDGNDSVGDNVSGESDYVDSSYYDTIPAPGQRQVAVEGKRMTPSYMTRTESLILSRPSRRITRTGSETALSRLNGARLNTKEPWPYNS